MKTIRHKITHTLQTGCKIVVSGTLVLAGIITIQTATPNSAAAAPFTCDNKFYQIINGDLHTLDPVNGSYVQLADTGASDINAAGYNIQDNHIYGINNDGAWTYPRGSLIRFEHDGTITSLGVPSGLANYTTRSISSGTFDDNGNLWVIDIVGNTASNPAHRALQRIDISTNTATTVQTSVPFGIDMVYANGKLYSITNGSNKLAIYDIASNTLTQNTISGLPTSNNYYGAAWYTSDGKMFFSRNNYGEIYEVTDYDTANPSAAIVLNGQLTNSNDGVNCPMANSPIPVSIIATDDNYTSKPIKSKDGGVLGNIFANDTANGEVLENRTSDVAVSIVDNDDLTGVTIDQEGDVHVPAETPVGTYHVTYQVCLANNSVACDTAIITIVVYSGSVPTGTTEKPNITDKPNPKPSTSASPSVNVTPPNTGAPKLALRSPIVPLSLAGLALIVASTRRYLK